MSSVASFRGEGEYSGGYDSGAHIPVTGGDDMDPSLGESALLKLYCWLSFIINALENECSLTHRFAFDSRLTAGGFRVIYDRETPFELRIQVRYVVVV